MMRCIAVWLLSKKASKGLGVISLITIIFLMAVSIPLFIAISAYFSNILSVGSILSIRHESIEPAKNFLDVFTFLKTKRDVEVYTCLEFLMCAKDINENTCKKYYGNAYSINECESFMEEKIKEIWKETKVEIIAGDYSKTFGNQENRKTPVEIDIKVLIPLPKKIETVKFRVW